MENLREDAVSSGVQSGTSLSFGRARPARFLGVRAIGSEAALGDGVLGSCRLGVAGALRTPPQERALRSRWLVRTWASFLPGRLVRAVQMK
jgi:hypothetical protein